MRISIFINLFISKCCHYNNDETKNDIKTEINNQNNSNN